MEMIPAEWAGYVTAFAAILGGIVTIASAIVPFTETPKDDEILAKVKGFLQRFSLFNPKQ